MAEVVFKVFVITSSVAKITLVLYKITSPVDHFCSDRYPFFIG